MAHHRIIFGLAILSIAGYAAAAQKLGSAEQEAVAHACESGDDAALERGLDTLAGDDLPDCVDDAFRILTNGVAHQRPVAVEMLLKHATAAELASAARQLRPDLYHDERRQIVRAIGLRKEMGALDELKPFLRDQDLLVRAAAVAGLADLKEASSVGLLLNPPPSLVDYTDIEGDGEDHLYAASVIGTIRALSGLNPENTAAILDWWHAGGKPIVRPADAALKGPANRPFAIPSFDIRFNPPEAKQILAARFGLRTDADWAALFESMETAAEQDRRIAGKIFGPLHPPYCRIDISTTQTMAASGGVSEGYWAFGSDCLITINAEVVPPLGWDLLFRHEYIHVLHRTQFEDQPRWLMEGLAVSISESPFHTSWTAQRVAANGLGDVVSQGGVSALVQWIQGVRSGENEDLQYALCGLVMDYLRFGGIPASGRRLYALMGECSRGMPPDRAFETAYGVSPRQMDVSFAKWVGAL
jgi:hypothetical protein